MTQSTRTSDVKIAIPRYNLGRIIQLRDKLCTDSMTEWFGFTAIGEHFDQFVDQLTEAIPRAKRQAVYDSCTCLAGEYLTEARLRTLFWRLAGNTDSLRRGVAVPPWHVQSEREWMPVQVTGWEFSQNKWGKPGGLFAMRILAGSACPMRIITFWTRGFSNLIARGAGYTSYRHDYPFGHPSELVGLRLWALIDPAYCQQGRPGFREVSCTQTLRNWNRGIIRKRFRHGWECPRGYERHCYKCHVGYDQCPAATHRTTKECEDAPESQTNTEAGEAHT